MKRLILLGGGHAHVKVLSDLADQPLPGWDVHLVTPYRRQIYSGMLPGWIAGHYSLEACALPLDTMAGRAAVALHQTAGTGLDLRNNSVLCADGTILHFDLLSVDTGPMPAIERLPGALEHALPIRPIEGFVAAWPKLVDRILTRCHRFDLAIVGAGAAGVELAFAIQRRAQADGWSHLRVTLVGTDELPLDGSPDRLRNRAAGLLKQRGVVWQGLRRVSRVESGRLEFFQGQPLSFDECLIVTGAAAPQWPRASGLATDSRGFIQVGPSLQSVSHPQVLAAGDIASYHEERPKSGVYAVRAGPVLAKNVRALCEGRTPLRWSPQKRALYLIATGGRHALASWGNWSWDGRWVWRWKDAIDRRFMRRFGASSLESARSGA
jgi:selenide,water dikinase